VQARSQNIHLSFVEDFSLGIRKAFMKIRTESFQTRELNEKGGVEKFAIFNQQAVSQKRCEIRPRLGLLLIANRKSYTRFRLVPKAMTLDDLEQQNKGFIDFSFFDFGL